MKRKENIIIWDVGNGNECFWVWKLLQMVSYYDKQCLKDKFENIKLCVQFKLQIIFMLKMCLFYKKKKTIK